MAGIAWETGQQYFQSENSDSNALNSVSRNNRDFWWPICRKYTAVVHRLMCKTTVRLTCWSLVSLFNVYFFHRWSELRSIYHTNPLFDWILQYFRIHLWNKFTEILNLTFEYTLLEWNVHHHLLCVFYSVIFVLHYIKKLNALFYTYNVLYQIHQYAGKITEIHSYTKSIINTRVSRKPILHGQCFWYTAIIANWWSLLRRWYHNTRELLEAS